jgi:hypothetical protein
MLEQILDYIHNWFMVEIERGNFSVSDGSIDVAPELLQDGQYFRIVGSVFNDGLHQWPAEDLHDEAEFSGEIWALAVPEELVGIAAEIEEWNSTYGDAVLSPFQSESFGGYSYTRGSGGLGVSSSPSPAWASAFAPRLNRWRKLA